MLKNEQIFSLTKRCVHMISGFKQLLTKVTYDEPPLEKDIFHEETVANPITDLTGR